MTLESAAHMADQTASLVHELMIVIAKAYQELKIPTVVLADVEEMQKEEAQKYSVTHIEHKEEEEECQLTPQSRNKLLN